MSYLDEQKKQAASFRFRSQLFKLNRLLAFNSALLNSVEFQEQAEKLEQLEKAEKRNRLKLSKLSRQLQAEINPNRQAAIIAKVFNR